MDWVTILGPLLKDVVLPLATTVLIGIGANYLKRRTGIEVSDAQKAIAKSVIEAVEEKALSSAKSGVVLTSEIKHTEAVTEYGALIGVSPQTATTAIDLAVGSHPVIGAFKISSEIPAIATRPAG